MKPRFASSLFVSFAALVLSVAPSMAFTDCYKIEVLCLEGESTDCKRQLNTFGNYAVTRDNSGPMKESSGVCGYNAFLDVECGATKAVSGCDPDE